MTKPYLSKAHLRTILKQAFPQFQSSYHESGIKRVKGTLVLGRSTMELECDRGNEVVMRFEFREMLMDAHNGVSELVQAEKEKTDG